METTSNGNLNNINKKYIKNKLAVKTFELRNSLLTDLFQNPHIKTVHHIFAALFIGLVANTVILDFIQNGKIHTGLHIITNSFGKIHVALFSWILVNIFVFLIYFVFNLWIRTTKNIIPKNKSFYSWNNLWIIFVICYYIFLFRLCSNLVCFFQLPPGSSAIVVFETARLIMKIHSYMRENISKHLNEKSDSNKVTSIPTFSKFLYFLFAPTLIYRDFYPRSKKIHWKKVVSYVIEIISTIISCGFIFDTFFYPSFEEFGKRKFTTIQIILRMSNTFFPGMLLLLCVFYLVLHCWQNLFAELLTFGDRLFYRDWWTVTTYGDYFRTWNIIVGDWLYIYIYKDIYEVVLPGYKSVAKLLVFIISSVVHEWALTSIFGFFFPANLVMFLFFGTALSYVKAPRTNLFNILFLYGLAVGIGILISLYTMEYFVRLNSPVIEQGYQDLLIPKLLTCDCYM